MAHVIRTDGTVRDLTPKDPSKGFTLDELKAAIGGGWIETVLLGGTYHDRDVLVVDEDGRSKGFPLNVEATKLYRGSPPRHGGVIVGDALRCRVRVWHEPGDEDQSERWD